MKVLSTVLLALLLLPGASSAAGRWMRFQATAYSTSGVTADQHVTRADHTVAADPAVLPFGTRVQIRHAGPYSGEYVVQDGGAKIGGRKIDIYIPSTAEAKQFGVKPVLVRVIRKAPPKSIERGSATK